MEDKCVFCGETVPEGIQVCPICEDKMLNFSSEEKSKPPKKKRKGFFDNLFPYKKDG